MADVDGTCWRCAVVVVAGKLPDRAVRPACHAARPAWQTRACFYARHWGKALGRSEVFKREERDVFFEEERAETFRRDARTGRRDALPYPGTPDAPALCGYGFT